MEWTWLLCWNSTMGRRLYQSFCCLLMNRQRNWSSSWLTCSVCPSVWGYQAVKENSHIPSSLYSSLVNEATNWGPQLETTRFGRPCSFQTKWRKSLAAPSAMTVMCVRTKCTLLETESMTVMTVLCPEDSGSLTTKLMLSVFHHASGTESSCSSPTGEYCQGFVQRQRSQVLTYWPMYLDI